MTGKSGAEGAEVGVVMISGSCCIPGMAPLDERARCMVEQAIKETGVKARVGMLPVSTAFAGGVPQDVFSQLVQKFNQSGQVGLPAILVDGKAVSFGLAEADKLKEALVQAAAARMQKEHAHE